LPILRSIARKWPFLAAGIMVLGLAGVAPAASQDLRLKAVDQLSRNPEFAKFHAGLLDAVRRRDVEYVVSRADSEIKLSFGDDLGRDTFRAWLTGADEGQGEIYWRELQTVLEFGGVFMDDGAFCTPYLACMDIPGCPDCDPYETVFVTKKEVVARTKPDAAASVAAWLSWNVLLLDHEQESPAGWYPVKLPDGKTGYLAYDDARMPIDYRARFEKTAEGWRMMVFIAGD